MLQVSQNSEIVSNRKSFSTWEMILLEFAHTCIISFATILDFSKYGMPDIYTNTIRIKELPLNDFYRDLLKIFISNATASLTPLKIYISLSF